MMCKIILCFLALLLTFSVSTEILAASDVNFSGTLVEEPCELAQEDSNIVVDLHTIVSKQLYQYKQSTAKLFSLHLINCDISLGNQVTVTFTGTEDTAQSGLLAFDASSTAKGAAILLRNGDGTPLALNKASTPITLATGCNILNFMALVQASDAAINNHTVVAGDFTATATFVLAYP